jgi:hypothetical protein
MKQELILRQEAEQDLAEAHAWCEERAKGLTRMALTQA